MVHYDRSEVNIAGFTKGGEEQCDGRESEIASCTKMRSCVKLMSQELLVVEIGRRGKLGEHFIFMFLDLLA